MAIQKNREPLNTQSVAAEHGNNISSRLGALKQHGGLHSQCQTRAKIILLLGSPNSTEGPSGLGFTHQAKETHQCWMFGLLRDYQERSVVYISVCGLVARRENVKEKYTVVLDWAPLRIFWAGQVWIGMCFEHYCQQRPALYCRSQANSRVESNH